MLIQTVLKSMKSHTKILLFTILHMWNQRLKICKNEQCKSFLPYAQQHEWILWN